MALPIFRVENFEFEAVLRITIAHMKSETVGWYWFGRACMAFFLTLLGCGVAIFYFWNQDMLSPTYRPSILHVVVLTGLSSVFLTGAQGIHRDDRLAAVLAARKSPDKAEDEILNQLGHFREYSFLNILLCLMLSANLYSLAIGENILSIMF